MHRRACAAWVALFAASQVSAAELTGKLGWSAETGWTVGGTTIALDSSSPSLEAHLRELIGKAVRVDGRSRTLRAYLVERLIDPRPFQDLSVVTRDDRKAGSHVLVGRHVVRAEPGPLTELLPSLDAREISVEGWRSDGREGRKHWLTGIKAVRNGREVWLRADGNSVVAVPVEGGPSLCVDPATLEIGEPAGTRQRVRGVIVWDPLVKVNALRTEGEVFELNSGLVRGPLAPFQVWGLEGFELELEGIVSPRPAWHEERRTLLVERAVSLEWASKLRGTLERGGTLRVADRRLRLRAGGRPREAPPEKAHALYVRAHEVSVWAAEKSSSLVALLGQLPAGAEVVVDGFPILDRDGQRAELVPFRLHAQDATGRPLVIEGLKDGLCELADGETKVAIADLVFDQRGFTGSLSR